MTTGTRTLDGQFSMVVKDPYWGTPITVNQIGPYWSKTWKGGNRPSRKKVPTLPPRQAFPQYSPPAYATNDTVRSYRAKVRAAKRKHAAAVKEWKAANPKRAKTPKPPFKRRVDSPNGYTMHVQIRDAAPYMVQKLKDPTWCAVVRLYTHEGTATHIALDPADEYRVIEKLRQRVYGTGFHPGIFAAEMPQALRMIASSATQIRLGLKSLVSGNWRGIIRNLGEPTPDLYGRARYSYLSFHEGRMSLSRAWLAFQYGWKPLVGDLSSGAAYVEAAVRGELASATRVSAAETFVKESWQAPSTYYVGFSRRTTIHRLRYVITDLKATPPTYPPSVASVAAIAWEVLPYSFVCDWAVPISGWLQALRTASDIQGTVVRSLKSSTSYGTMTIKNGYKAYPLAPGLSSRVERIDFKRTVSSEISPPTPVGSLLPSDVFSSWRRSLNAVALLQNLRFPELDRFGFKKLLGRKS